MGRRVAVKDLDVLRSRDDTVKRQYSNYGLPLSVLLEDLHFGENP